MSRVFRGRSLAGPILVAFVRRSGTGNRVGSVVLAALALIAGAFYTDRLFRADPTDAEALPLVIKFVIAFFTVEAVRMFCHVILGATFYRSVGVGPQYEPTNELVSVVVPVWNEAVGIGATIASLVANSYTDVEIVVVNDGSVDQTAEIVKGYVARFPGRIRLINQPNRGKGAALNTGVAFARGELLVSVDGDSALAPNAIARLVQPFADPGVDAVVGRIEVGNPKGWIRLTQAFEYMFGFHLKRAQSELNTIYILSGALCAFRRSAFNQTEGFRDYSKTEDMDYSLQLRQNQSRLVYATDAVCYTEGAADRRGLTNQRLRWKFGALVCLLRHRNLFFARAASTRTLGFYELPVSIIALLQTALYPLVLGIALLLPFWTGEYLFLVLVLLSVPINFFVVFLTNGTLRTHARHLPLLPFLIVTAMVVEFWVSWQALYKHAVGAEFSWTNWERSGLDTSDWSAALASWDAAPRQSAAAESDAPHPGAAPSVG